MKKFASLVSLAVLLLAESADAWVKSNSQNSDVVNNGVRIYRSASEAQSRISGRAYTVDVPNSLRGKALSAMGSIVITRCNEGDYNPGKKDKYVGSCKKVCGKKCYKENELQPVVQARAVIGNCKCPWSQPAECEKEEHHCTFVAPRCDCSAGQIGGSTKAHLEIAANSGGKSVKSNYVMQIKPSKDHGFFSVFRNSGTPYSGRLTQTVGPFPGQYDDDKKFKPSWNNVFSIEVNGGNKGRPIAVRGSFTMTLGPWDPLHAKKKDTCSPLVLTRVLFNKRKMHHDERQSDGSRDKIFSTKVSQNCLHPNWSTGQTRVCTYEFADTGLLDTNNAGYVSVALNLHKSCIFEKGQKKNYKGGKKAKGDFYKVTNVKLDALVLN